MNRPQYNKATRSAAITRANFHASILHDVEQAIKNNDIVVIGMALNPFVSRSKKQLEKKNVDYHYLEYGGYFTMWKERLAIKMWSGWPTFPQVFIKGTLVGGNDALEASITSGEFQQLLDGNPNE